MHYKAPDHSVHHLDSTQFEHLLPAGSIQITDEEAEAMRVATIPAPVPPTVAEQLAKLDTDNALSQRNLRDTILLMSEAFKTLSGGALDLAQLPGVAKVAQVEAQAAELRALL